MRKNKKPPAKNHPWRKPMSNTRKRAKGSVNNLDHYADHIADVAEFLEEKREDLRLYE